MFYDRTIPELSYEIVRFKLNKLKKIKKPLNFETITKIVNDYLKV